MLTGVWESPTIGLNEEIKFKNNLKNGTLGRLLV